MLQKFFTDYFSYQLSHLLGGRKYADWAEDTLTLQKDIPLGNIFLAQELEEACKANGFLTYAQFLTIEQFGTYGFHSTHKQHGMTDTRSRWPEALAALCQKKDMHYLVEFGPGDGAVGALTLLAAKKLHYNLSWSGVEISETLREIAKKNFQKKKLSIQQLVPSLTDLRLTEKCLFVFSYSIDNLIPEVFINSSSTQGHPNAMMGVSIENGVISEMILTKKELAKIGCSLTAGVFQDSSGYSWDLKGWQLHSMQRLYAPLEACNMLLNTANIIPSGSHILIIDEFRISSHMPTYHLGIPRDLETYSRDFIDFKKFYKTIGKNLLYFPPYADTIRHFLTQLGFTLEEDMDEHRLAYQLANRTFPYRNNIHPRTLALLTLEKQNNIRKKEYTLSVTIGA